MRYAKQTVNKIVNRVIDAFKSADLGIENNHHVMEKIELIREEFQLVDRRTSSLEEYTTEIVYDFMKNQFSYKELMKKYHCSFYLLMKVLEDCAESDPRVAKEIDFRRKD